MTPLLEVRGLTKHFRPRQGLLRGGQTVRAVEDVSFAIERGTTFALVGESGCGKTTVTRMILGLERPTAGTILFDGLDLTKASRAQMRSFRRRAHAVFQDPYASLNPRLRVRTIITEPLLVHEKRDAAALRRRIAEVLDIVGLPATAADL